MIQYTFNRQDAYAFAEFVGAQAKTSNGQLKFKYCPYCKGGKSRDTGTFAISLSTGQFNCARASCMRTGNMFTLAQDFDFHLPGIETWERPTKIYREFKTPEKPIKPKPAAIAYLESRGISAETAERFEITTQTEHDNILVLPFFDQDGKMTFIKYRKTDFDPKRDKNKEWCQAGGKPILFGMKQCTSESKTLIFTEGQLDCMSVAECGDFNVVSVPTGAHGFTWVPHCWDWVNRFESILVFGDHEKGHITLLDDLRARFKMRILVVREEDYKDCKDANDILRKYGKEQILQCITNAKEILLSNVKRLADVSKINVFDLPKLGTGITVLDRLLYGGLPFGGITLIAGKPGEGKSTLASQIVVNAIEQGHKIFAYSGELPNELFRAWMDLQVAGSEHIFDYQTKWGDTGYNISDTNRDAISAWYGDNIFIYDSTSVTDESTGLVRTAEEMILRNSIDVILIDNLMTALDLESTDERDKYERQSKFVKKLAALALTYNVIILLVAHKRKNNISTNENDEISGSGDIANLGMVTLAYEKDSNIDESDRILKVSKNRLFGKVNTEGWTTHFDERSKRIYVDNSDKNKIYGCFKDSGDYEYHFDGFAQVEVDESVPF